VILRLKTFPKPKYKKTEKNSFLLELKPNPDILAELGKKKKNQFLVGFALENSNSENRACSKMEKKGCDMMIYNNFDSSIGLKTTRISILARNGFNQKIPDMNKSEVAGIIFKKIIELSGFFHG